jgi:hypothetical protein
MSEFYNAGNYKEGILSSTLYPNDTQITIHSTTNFITPPALVALASSREIDSLRAGEIVLVTGSAGGNTYNITRTTPLEDRVNWSAGTYVLGNFFAEHLQQVTTAIDNLRWGVLFSVGGSEDVTSGIIKTNLSTTANADFRVVPSANDLEVSAYGGFCIIDRVPIYRTNTVLSIVLPASKTCGVFQKNDGTLTYVEDYVLGTTYTDKILLAVVDTPASGTISSGDIDDERAFF